MAREQRLLGEDLAEFMSRLEGHPTPAASAMALTMQQHVESTFPVRTGGSGIRGHVGSFLWHLLASVL